MGRHGSACFPVSHLKRRNKEEVYCIYLNTKTTDHTVAAFVTITWPVQRGLVRLGMNLKRLFRASVLASNINLRLNPFDLLMQDIY